MMQLVRLNSGFISVSTGAPGVDVFDVAGEDEGDQEPYGQVPLMQCLGVASLPSPPDSTGHAEGILLEGVGGLPGIVVAAWDTRTFSLFGNLEGGDTVLHSTGPNKSAQVLCKEKKRQVVMATVSEDGEAAMVVLDGKNKKYQVVAWGKMFEISEDNGIVLEVGSARIVVHPDNGVMIQGQVTLGGAAAVPGFCMAMATPATWAILAGLSGPITPILNVTGAL